MTVSGDCSFKAVGSGNMSLRDGSGETEGGSGVCAILQKGKPCAKGKSVRVRSSLEWLV